ncbi:MAG: 16S rRNA (adenine(1518)-N(6)/adenine(1519)-N(6))-dimethyltransferase RsmA [Paludibaculum sp.]
MGRPLGQHFLFQHSILARIAEAACPEQVDLCIEIGPGPGGLTEFLHPRAKRLIAIELDATLAERLRERYCENPSVEIVQGDVLSTNLGQWGRATVCGNLPYYITSPIVEQVLAIGSALERAVFLVQKEVADRLGAGPGSRDYGYLSVATQLFCSVERLFLVKPASFQPPPKVDSAVVRLTPRPAIPVADPKAFLRFASACFRQKRKTLRNNLAGQYGGERLSGLPEAGLRGEQLGLGELIRLFETLTG